MRLAYDASLSLMTDTTVILLIWNPCSILFSFQKDKSLTFMNSEPNLLGDDNGDPKPKF